MRWYWWSIIGGFLFFILYIIGIGQIMFYLILGENLAKNTVLYGSIFTLIGFIVVPLIALIFKKKENPSPNNLKTQHSSRKTYIKGGIILIIIYIILSLIGRTVLNFTLPPFFRLWSGFLDNYVFLAYIIGGIIDLLILFFIGAFIAWIYTKIKPSRKHTT